MQKEVFEKQKYTYTDIVKAVKYGVNYGQEESLNIPEDNITEWLSSTKNKTAEEWQNLEPEIRVISNDGWSKKSWYEEEITYKEYVERRNKNTCIKTT